jgi:hypothetical protein
LLRQLDESIWVIDHPLRLAGFLALGTRTTVVRLASGAVWLHSPGPLSGEERAAIEELGRVTAVVAPSKVHFLFAADAMRSFPEARLHAAPGLAEKRKELRVDEVLGDVVPEEWAADLDQTLVQGAPVLNEVVFLHRPRRTLLLTDLAFHVRRSDSAATRVFLRLVGAYGRLALSRTVRLMVRDRRAFRASLERILAWDFDRVVVTHGDVLDHGGPEALRSAWGRWLRN